jgi:hypothetical protein
MDGQGDDQLEVAGVRSKYSSKYETDRHRQTNLLKLSVHQHSLVVSTNCLSVVIGMVGVVPEVRYDGA